MVEWKIKGIYKADPQKVYDEINSIGEQFTPNEIVKKAEGENTELHKCFEWDDTKAAKAYRLHQAGDIIRSLVIVKESVDGREMPKTRAIVSTNEKNCHYEPVIVTVRNRDNYERLLQQALMELNAFKRKYANIRELEDVLRDIEALLAS